MPPSACLGERWSAADMSELDAALQQDNGEHRHQVKILNGPNYYYIALQQTCTSCSV
jgi:hypothetical protein